MQSFGGVLKIILKICREYQNRHRWNYADKITNPMLCWKLSISKYFIAIMWANRLRKAKYCEEQCTDFIFLIDNHTMKYVWKLKLT